MLDQTDTLDFVSIPEACRILGGEGRPISRVTYYRGVRDGRWPPPVRMGGYSRAIRSELIAAKQRAAAARGVRP
jgi:predicted DNA-binding transcriptional regulator AlpA